MLHGGHRKTESEREKEREGEKAWEWEKERVIWGAFQAVPQPAGFCCQLCNFIKSIGNPLQTFHIVYSPRESRVYQSYSGVHTDMQVHAVHVQWYHNYAGCLLDRYIGTVMLRHCAKWGSRWLSLSWVKSFLIFFFFLNWANLRLPTI